MKYVYGPLRSRRIGYSLGINITAYKVCSFDCIYCQLGGTTVKTDLRKEYVSSAEVMEELRLWLQINAEEAKKLDYITISGSGEPLLNTSIGDLIVRIKDMTHIPLAVITNSSLLARSEVRRQLLPADLVIPSLDAVSQEVLEKVDRPAAGISAEEIIGGLAQFRREYKGRIWLEVMLVKGINDSLAHIEKIKEACDRIRPDRIHLNSPVRSESAIEAVECDKKRLQKARDILGEKCQII